MLATLYAPFAPFALAYLVSLSHCVWFVAVAHTESPLLHALEPAGCVPPLAMYRLPHVKALGLVGDGVGVGVGVGAYTALVVPLQYLANWSVNHESTVYESVVVYLGSAGHEEGAIQPTDS